MFLWALLQQQVKPQSLEHDINGESVYNHRKKIRFFLFLSKAVLHRFLKQSRSFCFCMWHSVCLSKWVLVLVSLGLCQDWKQLKCWSQRGGYCRLFMMQCHKRWCPRCYIYILLKLTRCSSVAGVCSLHHTCGFDRGNNANKVREKNKCKLKKFWANMPKNKLL